jgi:UDP-glucuronate decarboxylase
MMTARDELTGPMNLGNPVETSVAELAQLIIELTGSRSEIVYRPLPIDDPIQRCPDISQAKAELDWQPRTALKPGLQRTIDYFDKLIGAGTSAAEPKSVAV